MLLLGKRHNDMSSLKCNTVYITSISLYSSYALTVFAIVTLLPPLGYPLCIYNKWVVRLHIDYGLQLYFVKSRDSEAPLRV